MSFSLGLNRLIFTAEHVYYISASYATKQTKALIIWVFFPNHSICEYDNLTRFNELNIMKKEKKGLMFDRMITKRAVEFGIQIASIKQSLLHSFDAGSNHSVQLIWLSMNEKTKRKEYANSIDMHIYTIDYFHRSIESPDEKSFQYRLHTSFSQVLHF